MKVEFDYEAYKAKEEAKRVKAGKKMIDIAKHLNKCGYKYIVVQYQGAGDSGDSYECEGYKTKASFDKSRYDGGEYIQRTNWDGGTSIPIPKDEWVWTRDQIEVGDCMKKYNKIHQTDYELEYMLTDLITYDWYNNEGGQGRVVLDTEKCIVHVDGQQNTNAYFNAGETIYLDASKPNEENYDTELQWDGY